MGIFKVIVQKIPRSNQQQLGWDESALNLGLQQHMELMLQVKHWFPSQLLLTKALNIRQPNEAILLSSPLCARSLTDLMVVL